MSRELYAARARGHPLWRMRGEIEAVGQLVCLRLMVANLPATMPGWGAADSRPVAALGLFSPMASLASEAKDEPI